MEEIRPGVKLETMEYGGTATAPALVVWGHGLCNALVGESTEKLWDFWGTMTCHRGVRGETTDADAGAPPPASAATTTTTDDDGEDDDVAMRVVRYSARGHGESSPAEAPSDCTWETLGRDMLALGRRLRRDPDQKLVLGGASMGSASAIYAAVHAMNEARATDATTAPATPGASAPSDEISGLVLVILPTFYDTRMRRKGQILAATERGFDSMAENKKIRPIFKDTPRASEPPQPLGVRQDSFREVMLGGAESDFPTPDVVAAAVASIPTLVLSWDCGDKTHPESSAVRFKADMAPHAQVWGGGAGRLFAHTRIFLSLNSTVFISLTTNDGYSNQEYIYTQILSLKSSNINGMFATLRYTSRDRWRIPPHGRVSYETS